MFEVGKRYEHVANNDGTWEVTAINRTIALSKCIEGRRMGDESYMLHSSFDHFKEVKPRIKRKVWFVHIIGFKDACNTYGFPSEERAKEHVAYVRKYGGYSKPLAMTCVEVEIEEGEGL